MRKESKIIVPDRNIEPLVPTTPGQDYLNKNIPYTGKDIDKYDLKSYSLVFYSNILDYIDTAINHPSSSSTQI